MNCDEFKKMLDDYYDDLLDENAVECMRRHSNTCVDCANEFAAANEIKSIMTTLDNDITVPLQAQAAWRSTIRLEAKTKRNKFLYRAVGAIAAALVLFIGISYSGLIRNPIPSGTETITENDDLDQNAVAANAARIEIDGVQESGDGIKTDLSRSSISATTCEMTASDFDSVINGIKDLINEYSGTLKSEQIIGKEGQRKASFTVQLPDEDINAFMESLRYIGDSTEFTDSDYTTEDHILINIFVNEA